MKLYINPLSPNARRATVVARHLGLAVEEVSLDFAKGELRKPEFLAINPNGRVPALVDGDYVLTESRAIMQYLAAQKPAAGLLPTDERARADVVRWQFWDAEHFSAATSTLAFEKLLKPMMGLGETSATAVADALGRFERAAKVLDAHLKGRDWMVGKSLTVADYTLACSLMYAGPCELSLEPYPNIKAWFGRIRELGAWRATEPKQG